MLRSIILLAWIPLVWQPTWGQTPSVRKNVAQDPKQKSELGGRQPEIGTEAAPFIVETHSRAESKEQAAEAEANKEHAARVERWTLIFTGAAAFFTGWLVWVGWRGVRAAIRTLSAIERQADLMGETLKEMKESNIDSKKMAANTFAVLEKQTLIAGTQATLMRRQADEAAEQAKENIKLMEGQAGLMARQAQFVEWQTKMQEAAMTQWVAIQNWKVSASPPIAPSNAPRTLHISYEIVNESSFPLTIKADFGFFGSLPGAVRQSLPYAYLLPKKPYPIRFNLSIKGDHAETFTNGELTIAVHGKFFHVGVTNKPSTLMAIHGNLVCGHAAPTRLEYEFLEMIPAGTSGDQPQDEQTN